MFHVHCESKSRSLIHNWLKKHFTSKSRDNHVWDFQSEFQFLIIIDLYIWILFEFLIHFNFLINLQEFFDPINFIITDSNTIVYNCESDLLLNKIKFIIKSYSSLIGCLNWIQYQIISYLFEPILITQNFIWKNIYELVNYYVLMKWMLDFWKVLLKFYRSNY